MVKASVRGANKLAGDFLALERAERGPTLKRAAKAGAKVAQVAIRARVPVKTGRLKRNIVLGSQRSSTPSTTQTATVRIQDGGKRKYATTKRNQRAGRVGKSYEQEGPAFYGKFLELGTRKMAAQPFMRPGFDGAQTEIAKAVEEAIALEIDKVLGGAR